METYFLGSQVISSFFVLDFAYQSYCIRPAWSVMVCVIMFSADLYNDSAAIQQKFFDMLTSYRMPPDSLYNSMPIADSMADYMVSTGTKAFNLLDFQNLVRQLEQGREVVDSEWQHRQLGMCKAL